MRGSGTATEPVTVTGYGSGNRPYIYRDNGVDDEGVRIDNADGYRNEGLELANARREALSLYITKEKMNAARRLLLQDGMKVGDAAKRVGYNNPNYFAKVFRNTFGMSPQEYKVRMFL
ncbi:putative DNA-binding response regulator [Paenibacillus sp. 598K]|uniref:helix-turn-helix transcriptional regulator n=1 Tax=Paenibacillus sp. 598K TaxID=1117987 RepID=UPI000FF93FE9|nr:helix-turn-helix transcriptional regulator [Paenibacillus sp. 598K]GBF75185.1 putative DNA-binding response regulator [Paenibacillus sp. 598K]